MADRVKVTDPYSGATVEVRGDSPLVKKWQPKAKAEAATTKREPAKK
ncbi:MAG TPA: hypothetical protein GXZ60_11290 [Intrasporangiaceae bacterium]|nr:hypothetical protein [Intrasporangiaceae bacterium]